MSCTRCPHHVRHGQPGPQPGTIEFQDLCGLKLKRTQDTTVPKKGRGRGRPQQQEGSKMKPLPEGSTMECVNIPFPFQFEYTHCEVYFDTFACSSGTNDALPTKDIQFAEQLKGLSVGDMELL
ncbi:MAG: hypothetical protein AB8C84_00890 [Oligoflexales bacterium]